MRGADKTDDLKRASYANPYKRVKGKYTNHYKTTRHWTEQSLRVTRWKCVTLYIWFCVWHDQNNKCHCNFEKCFDNLDVIRKWHLYEYEEFIFIKILECFNKVSRTFFSQSNFLFVCLKATLHKRIIFSPTLPFQCAFTAVNEINATFIVFILNKILF